MNDLEKLIGEKEQELILLKQQLKIHQKIVTVYCYHCKKIINDKSPLKCPHK